MDAVQLSKRNANVRHGGSLLSIMTEDIDDLQRECVRAEVAPRTLFVIGNILDRKKPYMSAPQIRVQIQIEARFKEMQRVLGFAPA